MHDLFLGLDMSSGNAKCEPRLFSKKFYCVCLHMAILRKNLELCQNLLIEENQRDKLCTFSTERYQQYWFSLTKSDYVYQKNETNDNEHLGVHFTSPEMSYRNCKTFSADTVVSFESSEDLK